MRYCVCIPTSQMGYERLEAADSIAISNHLSCAQYANRSRFQLQARFQLTPFNSKCVDLCIQIGDVAAGLAHNAVHLSPTSVDIHVSRFDCHAMDVLCCKIRKLVPYLPSLITSKRPCTVYPCNTRDLPFSLGSPGRLHRCRQRDKLDEGAGCTWHLLTHSHLASCAQSRIL